MNALLVALGAAVGGPLRLLVSRIWPGARGTLAVNLAGSLLLGLCFGLGQRAYALVGVGFCGALTTFSTFALETVEDERPLRAASYVGVTLAACLGAAALGLWVA